MNPSSSLARPQQYAVLAALAVLMAVTRYHHFVPVPDASWAIFFIGGCYLKGLSRWAFPVLMLEAAAIDYFSTQHLGVSSYCMSPAYAFLVPTHAALWLGGNLLAGQLARGGSALKGLTALGVSAFVSVSVAFALSNGGFYWFGGRYPTPNVDEYLSRFAQYYPHFLAMPCLYIGIVAAIHVAIVSTRRAAARTQQQ